MTATWRGARCAGARHGGRAPRARAALCARASSAWWRASSMTKATAAWRGVATAGVAAAAYPLSARTHFTAPRTPRALFCCTNSRITHCCRCTHTPARRLPYPARTPPRTHAHFYLTRAAARCARTTRAAATRAHGAWRKSWRVWERGRRERGGEEENMKKIQKKERIHIYDPIWKA